MSSQGVASWIMDVTNGTRTRDIYLTHPVGREVREEIVGDVSLDVVLTET